MVSRTAVFPCRAFWRACSATGLRQRGVVGDLLNRRGHVVNRGRHVDDLLGLVFGPVSEVLRGGIHLVGRVGHFDRCGLHAADNFPQLLNGVVEGVRDRTRGVRRQFRLHREVAVCRAAHFFQQFHDRRL